MASSAQYTVPCTNGEHIPIPLGINPNERNTMLGHQVTFKYSNDATESTAGALELYARMVGSDKFNKLQFPNNDLANLDGFVFEGFIDAYKVVISDSNGTGTLIMTDLGY